MPCPSLQILLVCKCLWAAMCLQKHFTCSGMCSHVLKIYDGSLCLEQQLPPWQHHAYESHNFLTWPSKANNSATLPLFSQCIHQWTNQHPHNGLLIFMGMHLIGFWFSEPLVPTIVLIVIAIISLSQITSTLPFVSLSHQTMGSFLQLAFQLCPIAMGRTTSIEKRAEVKELLISSPN